MTRSLTEITDILVGWMLEPGRDQVLSDVRSWDSSYWLEARFRVQILGIAPLLFAFFTRIDALQDLDAGFSAYLSEQATLNRQRMERAMADISTVRSICGSAKVPVRFLKGSELIHSYYDDPSNRPMSDIDILIKPCDLPVLAKALKQEGFIRSSDTPKHAVFIRSGNVVTTDGEHPDNPIDLEVHTQIVFYLTAVSIDFTRIFWQEPPLPPAVVLFLHVAVHAAANMFNGSLRAIQLQDLKLITRKLSAKHWEAITAVSLELKLAGFVYAPLYLAEKHLKAQVPESFFASLEPFVPESLKRYLLSARLDTFSLVSEEMTLRFHKKHLASAREKTASFLYQVALKHTLYFVSQPRWFPRGGPRLAALCHAVTPTAVTLRTWYPNWIRKYSLPIAYLIHGLMLSVLPLTALAGINRIRQRLGAYVRLRIWETLDKNASRNI